MNLLRNITCGLLFCTLLFPYTLTQAQDKTQVKDTNYYKYMPSDDIAFFILVKDVPSLRKKIDESKVKEVVTEDMKKFFEKLSEKLAKTEPTEEDWEKTEKLWKSLKGEIAVIISAKELTGVIKITPVPIEPAQEKKTPEAQIHAILNFKDAREEMDEIAKWIDEDLREKEVDVSTKKHEDIKYTVYKCQKTKKIENVLAKVDGALVLGSNVDFVEKFITNYKKKKEDLGTKEWFKRLDKTYGQCDMYATFLVGKIWQKQIKKLKEEAEDEDAAKMQEELLKESGILSLKSVDAGLKIGKNTIKIRVGYELPSKLDGVWKILDVKKADITLPRLVPSDAQEVGVSTFNLKGFWEWYKDFLNTILEQTGMDFEMLMEQIEEQIGFDLEEDLIETVGNQILTVTVPVKDKGAPAILFKIEDTETLQTTIEDFISFLDEQGAEIEEEEYMGKDIYYTTSGVKDAIGFSLVNNYLVFGTLESIKKIVRQTGKDAKAFSDSKEYEELMKKIPEGSLGWASTSRERIKIVIDQLRKGNIFPIFGSVYEALMQIIPQAPQVDTQQMKDIKEVCENLPEGKVFKQKIARIYSYSEVKENKFCTHWVVEFK